MKYVPCDKEKEAYSLDDKLYVSYFTEIEEVYLYERIKVYEKCDVIVVGENIKRFLKSVKRYSSFDLFGIERRLEKRKNWFDIFNDYSEIHDKTSKDYDYIPHPFFVMGGSKSWIRIKRNEK